MGVGFGMQMREDAATDSGPMADQGKLGEDGPSGKGRLERRSRWRENRRD